MRFILTLLLVFLLANVSSTAQGSATLKSQRSSQEPICPENVKQVRLLISSTYNSCDAMDHTLTRERIEERRRNIQNGSPNRLSNVCQYSSGQNCANIPYYDPAVNSHPYNSLSNKCEGVERRCMLEEQLRVCPSFYYMGVTSEFAVPLPYTGNIESIDPPAYKSRDMDGNEFVGWDCSRYLATAMRLAGFKIICDNTDIFDTDGDLMTATSGWTVNRISEAADYEGVCSCMDTVDLRNPDEQIKPGDILLYATHAMMIEASANDFMGEFTDPILSEQNFSAQSCIASENDCISEIDEQCFEDNIEPSDFKFSINHSDDVLGGIGPVTMKYEDYRIISGIRTDSWIIEREHISNLCKARLCNKYSLMENEACRVVSEHANAPQDSQENRFFKVIRHNSSKESCIEQNPPILQNSCGETCNARVEDKSCLYSGG